MISGKARCVLGCVILAAAILVLLTAFQLSTSSPWSTF